MVYNGNESLISEANFSQIDEYVEIFDFCLEQLKENPTQDINDVLPLYTLQNEGSLVLVRDFFTAYSKVTSLSSLSDNTDVYNIVKNIEGISWILPPEIFANKNKYDEILYKLFSLIILYGSHDLMMLSRTSTESVAASNYLKKDKNYIDIIHMNWNFIEKEIKDIFSGLQNK